MYNINIHLIYNVISIFSILIFIYKSFTTILNNLKIIHCEILLTFPPGEFTHLKYKSYTVITNAFRKKKLRVFCVQLLKKLNTYSLGRPPLRPRSS